LEQFSAIGLTGPRQSGKSTLLRKLLPNYQYITFDDPLITASFEEDPQGFMNQYNNQVIFDEVQYVPDIFRYVKIAIDNDRSNKGKFVLTGSSQFSLIKNIRESLAGRISLLTLSPFQFNELPQTQKTKAQYQGSYPELVLADYEHSHSWYAAYFDTYLHKDIAQLAQVGDIRQFRNFVKLLASHIAQPLNQSSLARDIGVSVPTISRWLSVLEASYIIFLLPPYFKNLNKRISKSAKIYFYDNGLAAYLLGLNDPELIKTSQQAGALFENYIISEVKKQLFHSASSNEIYYLRTTTGEEIDLIIDKGTTKDWIEIKLNQSPNPQMVRHIKNFIQDGDQGRLVYTGKAFGFSDTIQAVNYTDFLNFN
jgi:predicted AAA+ superfamily ATPase